MVFQSPGRDLPLHALILFKSDGLISLRLGPHPIPSCDSMCSALLGRLQHKSVSGYSLPTPDLRTCTYRVVALLSALLAEVWNAVAAQEELKCSPFPVPPAPQASSAPTAREDGRRTGSWGARWKTRSWSTGQGDPHDGAPGSWLLFCITSIQNLNTTGKLPLPQYPQMEKKIVSLCKWKLGTQLGKTFLQHYTISKAAIKFLSLTTLSKQISCITFPFT